MIFVMNEKKYAEKILNGKDYGNRKNYLYTTNVIAKYYTSLGYSKSEIKNALKKIIKERDPCVSDNSIEFWIKKSLECSDNHPLYEINNIIITKPEIEKIKSIHSEKFKDYRIQKLAFTLLCLAKFGNARGIKEYWVNINQKRIFNIANIKGLTLDKQCLLINELYKSEYIDINPKIESHSIRVLGIASGDTEIVVDDINESGMVYEEIFMEKKYTRCQKCGKMVAITNGRNMYCNQCAVEVDREKARERMRKIGIIT